MSRIVRYVENACTATQSQALSAAPSSASADPLWRLCTVGDPRASFFTGEPQVSYVLIAVLLITFLMYYLLWVGIHRTFFRPQGQE